MFDTEQEGYKLFRDIVRERTNRILVWIGSGLSQPAGVPSWSGLRNSLCIELENKAKSIVEEASGRERLLNVAKKAKQESNMWIAFEMLKRKLGEASFPSSIRAQFKDVDTCPMGVHP